MGEERDATQDAAQDRVTIQEAARRLGVKEDAIRKRIQRQSLRHEKDEDGRVYVWVDATQDTRRTSQDTTQDAAQDERLEDLKEQIGYLRRQLDEEREARRRADTIIAQLARANEEQSRTIRELEAPQMPSEDAETVEEAPDRAEEPQSVTEGAQEGPERPQEQSGWRVPVDRLHWWHYVLGLVLVGLASLFLEFILIDSLRIVENGVPAGVLGFWVGFRRRNPRFWSQIIPFGVLVGLVVVLGDVATTPLREFVRIFEAHSWVYWSGFLTGYVAATVLAGWLFYVSGALIGSAWQRRHTERISDTTPPSPMPGANLASPRSRSGWTPRQQAILGFVGTVIAALISFMGAVFSAIVAGGG